MMANPNILIRKPFTKAQQALRRLESFAAPGRPSGKAAGSHIDDLTEQMKAIWLCSACKYKFDHMRHSYFYEKNMRVNGRCDGCDEFHTKSHLYVHDSLVVQNGKSRHGNSWLPR